MKWLLFFDFDTMFCFQIELSWFVKRIKNYLATTILRHPEKKFYFSFTKQIFPFSIFLSHLLSFFFLIIVILKWKYFIALYINIPWNHTKNCFILHFSTLFSSLVSQPGNTLLPLIIFRGPENTEEENEHFSLAKTFSSHSAASPLCFWLKMSPDTCYKNPYIDQRQIFVWSRAFWFFWKEEEKSPIVFQTKRSNGMQVCWLPPQIQHFSCAWIILPWALWGLLSPGNLASAEQLFQLFGPSSTPLFCGKEVEVWPWTLELACGVT